MLSVTIDRKASINTAVGIQEDISFVLPGAKNTLGQKAACCKMVDSRHQNRSRTPPGRLPDSRKSPLQKAAADRSVNTDCFYDSFGKFKRQIDASPDLVHNNSCAYTRKGNAKAENLSHGIRPSPDPRPHSAPSRLSLTLIPWKKETSHRQYGKKQDQHTGRPIP